jgi:hypothetical protein
MDRQNSDRAAVERLHLVMGIALCEFAAEYVAAGTDSAALERLDAKLRLAAWGLLDSIETIEAMMARQRMPMPLPVLAVN